MSLSAVSKYTKKSPNMNSNEKEPLLIEPSPDTSSSENSLGFEKNPKNKSPAMEKLSKPPRKRSRIACTWCRDRKVRCDASSHGTPCTNCELDQQECVVHSVSQNIRAKKPASRHQPYPSPTTPNTLKSSVFQSPEASSRSPLISHSWNEGETGQTPWRTPPHPSSSSASSASSSTTQLSTVSDVFYSFHTFIKLPCISEIPQEDIQYLTLKGCFRVPSGATLDEFIRKYFLYVHPCLPIINEAELWQMYYRQPSPGGENGGVSLFTFQAMLFASSAFVSPKAIRSAGFTDTRTARNALYTRAKLLYDLGCEKSPLSTAQGSLLLTHQSSPSDLHAGSLWLSIAIQSAIVYNALHPTSADNIKKRIWWSILLRDRIISLGLRRHPQITPQTLDLDLTGTGVACGSVLGEKDFEDEISGSEVYDPETKRLLARVVGVQCELAVCLGDVLGVVHSSAPASLSPGMRVGKIGGNIQSSQTQTQTQNKTPSVKKQVAKCKASLLRWSTGAKAALGAVVNSHMTHESVSLFFGLTFFYYHAARLALCNFEALSIQQNKGSNTTNNTKPDSDTEDTDHERIQDELEDATGCITDTIKRFLAQGVAHHLPISAIPLVAHPLLLSALDVKLSSTKSQSATRKRRFRYYANLMQVFQHRYDGTDTVAAFIQQTLQFADYILPQARRPSSKSDKSESGSGSSEKCSSWSELFADFPKLYLRLLLALDYAFSRGYFPSYGEVQGLLCVDDIHTRGEGEAGDVELMPPSSSEGMRGLGIKTSASPSYSNPIPGTGTGGQMPNLTNLYTLVDSEQQQQQQHHHHHALQTSSAELYTIPDCETQVVDPLVMPTYNPMLDSQYAYPGHLPFAHQNYGCEMYPLYDNGILDESGSSDFLNLGSSSSESYSDILPPPVGVGEEGCVNG